MVYTLPGAIIQWTVVCALNSTPVILDSGFVISEEANDLIHATQITFGPDGRLYAAVQSGTIAAYEYGLTGIQGGAETVAIGVGSILLGIGFDEQGDLYASSNEGDDDTGFLARLLDLDDDGFYETIQKFVTQLPNKLHHNDQLAIDGRILYVGMGSRTDDGEADDVEPIPAATLLKVDLDQVDFKSPDNLPEVYAYGLRNPFGIALDEQGRVWVGDNGRDTPLLPDEFNLIFPGAHHGFPSELAPPDAIEPVITLGLGTSADGLDIYPTGGPWGADYEGLIFLTRFDYELNDPKGVGQDVVKIAIDESDPKHPTATATVFIDELTRPLDVEVDPYGNLVVMEYGPFPGSDPGRIFRVALLQPADSDVDGDVDAHDFAAFQLCFTGASQPPDGLPEGCGPFDQDSDEDVDLIDYVFFQGEVTGP